MKLATMWTDWGGGVDVTCRPPSTHWCLLLDIIEQLYLQMQTEAKGFIDDPHSRVKMLRYVPFEVENGLQRRILSVCLSE